MKHSINRLWLHGMLGDAEHRALVRASKLQKLFRSRGDNLLSTLPKGIGSYLFTPSQARKLQLALTKCRSWLEPLGGWRCLVVGYPAPKKQRSPAPYPKPERLLQSERKESHKAAEA